MYASLCLCAVRNGIGWSSSRFSIFGKLLGLNSGIFSQRQQYSECSAFNLSFTIVLDRFSIYR